MLNYFENQLAENRESYLRKRDLIFRVEGKRRWFVKPRKSLAYVWQSGRFEDDIEFWKRGLSDPSSVDPVKRGKCVRFYLETENDFKFFHKAFSTELQNADWVSLIATGKDEDSDED